MLSLSDYDARFNDILEMVYCNFVYGWWSFISSKICNWKCSIIWQYLSVKISLISSNWKYFTINLIFDLSKTLLDILDSCLRSLKYYRPGLIYFFSCKYSCKFLHRKFSQIHQIFRNHIATPSNRWRFIKVNCTLDILLILQIKMIKQRKNESSTAIILRNSMSILNALQKLSLCFCFVFSFCKLQHQ